MGPVVSESKVIQCPKCKQKSTIQPQNQPTQITCPGCQAKLRIPVFASAPQSTSQSATTNPFPQLSTPSTPALQDSPIQQSPALGGPLSATNPYQAPHPSSADATSFASPADQQRSGRYVRKPLKVLGWIACIGVLLTSVNGVLISTLETIGEAMFPGFNSPNVEASLGLEVTLLICGGVLGLLTVFTFLAAAIASCMFLYRASANLHAANTTNMQYTPGWAAGYWFIPFLNLVRPYEVTNEIWNRSGKGTSSITMGGSLFGVWWGCWILSNILGQIESRAAIRGWDLGQMYLPLSWASSLTALIAGICFFRIVCGIMQRQSA